MLIYQMLLQQSPFRGEDEDEIYDAILADEPLYPIHMPRDSVSILQKLLTREPEIRLGSGVTDAQEIMSHAFFRNINWDDVYNKRVPAPFKPEISNPTDTSNFDSEFTSVTPVLTPVQSGMFVFGSIRPLVLEARFADKCDSALAGDAGGIPRLLLLGGLCLMAPAIPRTGPSIWGGFRGRVVHLKEGCRKGAAKTRATAIALAAARSSVPFRSVPVRLNLGIGRNSGYG